MYAKFNGKNTGEVVNSFDATLARRQCRSGRPREGELERPSPYGLTCRENPPPPMLADVAAYLQSVDERRALPAAIHAALAASHLFTWPLP